MTTLSTVCNWEIILLSWIQLDRQCRATTPAKTMDEQKASTRKYFWTRTSVKGESLSHLANHMRQQKPDSMAESTRSTSGATRYVQVNGVVKSLKTIGYLWGLSGVSLADGQTSLYNPEKAKASLRKPCWIAKQAFNSFGLHCRGRGTTAWSTKFFKSQSQRLRRQCRCRPSKGFGWWFQNITYFSDTAAGWEIDTISQAVLGSWLHSSTYLESISPVKWFCLHYLGIDGGSIQPLQQLQSIR